jgi:hypothetical protein
MGWRLRRSIKVAPGLRLNFSRRGVGFSAGPRGFKIGRGADGRYRRTVSIPGTGLYNTTVIGSGEKHERMTQPPQQWTAPPTWPQPAAGWSPPPGWQPDPAWGPAPDVWQFWQPTQPSAQGGPVVWARKHPKTAATAGVLTALFIIGSIGGGGDDEGRTEQEIVALFGEREAEQEAEDEAARKAVEEARAAQEAAAAKAAAEAAARAEAERVAAEQAAVAAAAEAARVEAEKKAAAEAAARAEAERRAAEQAAAAAKPAPAMAPAPAAGTDPRFGTCKEAKANGYGNYRQGQDSEYDWYRDADNDGVVCE